MAAIPRWVKTSDPPLTYLTVKTMASIAQLLAAKKNLATGPIVEDHDTKEAIDRIDPPGKRVQSIVLGKTMDEAQQGPELPVPSNDQALCIVERNQELWLAMPCENPADTPIMILRLPWVLHPSIRPLPTDDGIPY